MSASGYLECFGKGPEKCEDADDYFRCLDEHQQKCEEQYLNHQHD